MEKTMIGEHYNFRDCANYLKAELARRDEIIARLKEDGERLAQNFIENDSDHGGTYCIHCHHNLHDEIYVNGGHYSTCPITLHRALMNELEED